MASKSKTDPDAGPPTGDSKPVAAKAPDELAALKDRYHRLLANFDNFQKRTAEESKHRAREEKEAFICELLPVIDNFERAFSADSSLPQLREGLEMTLRQFQQLLRKHAFEADDPKGRPFDPHRHEAVATRHDPSQPGGVVLDVLQRGYHRGSHVLRPAKVIVNDPAGTQGDSHAG